jgi:hypothetical protein
MCFPTKNAALLLMAGACLCVKTTVTMACATCGCTLSADAAMGYTVIPGWRLSLEEDYIDQDELRTGTSAATPAQVVDQPSDPSLAGGEIEKQTINRYLTFGINYSPTSNWNFGLFAPYVIRDHTTYGVQFAPYTASETAPNEISGAHVSAWGDVRLIGSYQGFLEDHNLGVQLGVKLPTGQFGARVDFNSGPNSGAPLDASLQAGTGSTDIILGAYFYQAISRNFSAFINGQFQAAVAQRQNEPGSDFRPGNTATMSLGLRYEASPRWVPQLQLNLNHKAPDDGALADLPDTAGTVIYLSPGVTVPVSHHLNVFGFVQVPVYSKLDGYQVFPHWTASVGASYAF